MSFPSNPTPSANVHFFHLQDNVRCLQKFSSVTVMLNLFLFTPPWYTACMSSSVRCNLQAFAVSLLYSSRLFPTLLRFSWLPWPAAKSLSIAFILCADDYSLFPTGIMTDIKSSFPYMSTLTFTYHPWPEPPLQTDTQTVHIVACNGCHVYFPSLHQT